MDYKKGDDYKDGDYVTYGITYDSHDNKIEVHGDETLRDKILELLNQNKPIIRHQERNSAMMSPRERYERDPHFHALVNMMLTHIQENHCTPTEIREAALLAHIVHDERHNPIKPLPLEIEKWLNNGPTIP